MIHTSLLSLTLAASGAAANPPDADLQAIASCVSAGAIKGVETHKRGGPAGSRAIQVSGEPDRRVSVLEGYRVMLATPQGKYFVNLKIERSAHDQAETDREAIRRQMQAMASRAPAGSPPLKRQQGDGIETLGLDQPTLDSGSLGFYTLFVPQADLVVTAYLLNQPPAERAFATYADYERLRDQALVQIKGCLPRVAN
jgi:hypothetical protein